MGNFFKSFFSSGANTEGADDSSSKKKNFDIFKYDGVRAQKMGQVDYAIKCYKEALNLEEDFETLNYLVGAYTQKNKLEDALEITNRMVELEPEHINTLLMRANLSYMLEIYPVVLADCEKVITLEETNHPAYFLLAKAKKATLDLIGAIVAITKTIALKEDFSEGYLLRAEVLHAMHQEQEAIDDIEKVIELSSDEENAF